MRSPLILSKVLALGVVSALLVAPGPDPHHQQSTRKDLYGEELPYGATARLGNARLRLGTYGGVVFSPDGRRLAVWATSWNIMGEGSGPPSPFHLIDVETGAEVARIRSEKLPRAATFSDDGKRIIWVDGKGTLLEHQIDTGKRLRKVDGFAAPSEPSMARSGGPLAIAPGGRLVASAGDGRVSEATVVLLGNGETGERYRDFKDNADPVTSLAVSEDRQRVVIGMRGGAATVRDAASGKVIFQAGGGHKFAVVDVAPSGNLWGLVEVLDEGELRVTVRTMQDGETVSRLEWPGAYMPVYEPILRLSAVGKVAAVTGIEEVVVFDTEEGTERFRLPIRGASGLAISPDGSVLSVVADGRVHILNATDGSSRIEDPSHDCDIDGAAFWPDGTRIATSGEDGTIRLWEASTGRFLRRWESPRGDGSRLSFSSSGRYLAASREATRVYDLRKDDPILEIEGAPRVMLPKASRARMAAPRRRGGETSTPDPSPEHLTCYAFAPTRDAIVIGYGSGAVKIHDLTGGEPGDAFPGDGEPALGVAYAADESEIRVVDAAGRLRWLAPERKGPPRKIQIPGSDRRTLAVFSRGAKWLACGDESGNIDIVDAKDGRLIRVLSAGSLPVTHLRFLGRGRRLFAATHPIGMDSGEMFAREERGERFYGVWDVFLGRRCHFLEESIPMAPFTPHAIAPSSDGRVLVTGGNMAVQFCDLLSGGIIETPLVYSVHSWAIASSPDGRSLVTGLRDGTAVVWDLDALAQSSGGLPTRFGVKDVGRLWGCLAGEDAGRAYLAARRLAARGADADGFLAHHMKPVPHEVSETVRILIEALDEEDFEWREGAEERLVELGEEALLGLRETLAKTKSPEVKLRIGEALDRIGRGTGPPYEDFPCGQLRTLRAIGVLEAMGSAKAIESLERVASGSPYALETVEARAALEALAARGPAGK